MKPVEIEDIDKLPGIRIKENDTFCFRCHPEVECFNRCCRNLNLFMYPYDVHRLKQSLGISSDEFLDRYVDIVLRPTNFFPDVLLRMAENSQKTCPFLIESGCSVYPDRPDTCRTFPIEQGMLYDADRESRRLFIFSDRRTFVRGSAKKKNGPCLLGPGIRRPRCTIR